MKRFQLAIATLAGAALLGLLAGLAGLDGPLLYAFGGAALAVAVLLGTPYAFPVGDGSVGPQSPDVMKADEPAVGAENGDHVPTFSNGERAALRSRLDEGIFLSDSPGLVAAHGTIRADAFTGEVRLEFVELGVGHSGSD